MLRLLGLGKCPNAPVLESIMGKRILRIATGTLLFVAVGVSHGQHDRAFFTSSGNDTEEKSDKPILEVTDSPASPLNAGSTIINKRNLSLSLKPEDVSCNSNFSKSGLSASASQVTAGQSFLLTWCDPSYTIYACSLDPFFCATSPVYDRYDIYWAYFAGDYTTGWNQLNPVTTTPTYPFTQQISSRINTNSSDAGNCYVFKVVGRSSRTSYSIDSNWVCVCVNGSSGSCPDAKVNDLPSGEISLDYGGTTYLSGIIQSQSTITSLTLLSIRPDGTTNPISISQAVGYTGFDLSRVPIRHDTQSSPCGLYHIQIWICTSSCNNNQPVENSKGEQSTYCYKIGEILLRVKCSTPTTTTTSSTTSSTRRPTTTITSTSTTSTKKPTTTTTSTSTTSTRRPTTTTTSTSTTSTRRQTTTTTSTSTTSTRRPTTTTTSTSTTSTRRQTTTTTSSIHITTTTTSTTSTIKQTTTTLLPQIKKLEVTPYFIGNITKTANQFNIAATILRDNLNSTLNDEFTAQIVNKNDDILATMSSSKRCRSLGDLLFTFNIKDHHRSGKFDVPGFKDGLLRIESKKYQSNGKPFSYTLPASDFTISVDGTDFDMQKHAFPFPNGRWSYPNKDKKSDNLFKVVDVITSFLPPSQRSTLWKNIGYYDKNGKATAASGLCYGMAAAAIGNFTYRFSSNSWGESCFPQLAFYRWNSDGDNSWRDAIIQRWAPSNQRVIPPYKPYSYEDSNIWLYSGSTGIDMMVDNNTALETMKKIIYYHVGQDYFGYLLDVNPWAPAWPGESDAKDFSLESVRSLLHSGNPVLLSLDYDEGAHAVAITQYIQYKMGNEGLSGVLVIYDNRNPYMDGIQDAPAPFSCIEIPDELHAGNLKNHYLAIVTNELILNPDSHSFSSTGFLPSEEDRDVIYNILTNTSYTTKKETISRQQSVNTKGLYKEYKSLAESGIVEATFVGMDQVKVFDRITHTQVPIDLNGIPDSNNVVLNRSPQGFVSVLSLPIQNHESGYLLEISKDPNVPRFKMYINHPNQEGGMDIVGFGNVPVEQEDTTRFTVRLDFQRKEYVLEKLTEANQSSPISSEFHDNIELQVPAVKKLNARSTGSSILLTWDNPIHPKLRRVRIIRKTGSTPTLPDDGIVVYDGNGEEVTDSNTERAMLFYRAFSITDNGFGPDSEETNIDNRLYSIGGKVSLQGTNTGIADSLVSIEQNGTILYRTQSDTSGRYGINNLSAGSYTVRCQSSTGTITDSLQTVNIGPNSATIDFHVISAPDLVFSSTDIVEGTSLSAGQTIRIQADIVNKGSQTGAANMKEMAYISPTPILKSKDIGPDTILLSNTPTHNVNIAPNRAYHVEFSNITIPSKMTAGNYYLVIKADGDDTLKEGDEDNNLQNIAIEIKSSYTPLSSRLLEFPQLAVGGEYRSFLYLSNPNNTATKLTANLISPQGTPMTILINGVQRGFYTDTIPAYGSLKLRLEDSGSMVRTGWAQVSTDQPIGGMMVYQNLSQGIVLSEATVFPAPRMQKVFLMAPILGSASETGLAIANPGDSNINVNLRLVATNGVQVAHTWINLGPKEQRADFLFGLFSGISTIPEGMLEISAPQDFIAMGLIYQLQSYVGGNDVFSTIPIDTTYNTLLEFPQLASGGGYRSFLYLSNPSGSTANVITNLYTPQGTPLSLNMNGVTNVARTDSIPPNGSLRILLEDSGGSAKTGWAQIHSTQPVTGMMVYQNMENGRVLSEATVTTSSRSANGLLMSPILITSTSTGIAIANPNAASANIAMRLISADGSEVDSTQFVLEPMNQRANFCWQFFPKTISIPEGMVEISGSKDLLLTGLLYQPQPQDNDVFTTLPIVIPNILNSGTTTTSSTTTTSTSTTSTTQQTGSLAPYGYIESPTNGSSHSYSLNVSGWVYSKIYNPYLEILVDGNVVKSGVNMTIRREDICRALGTTPNCPYVGFSENLDISSLPVGEHKLLLRVTTMDGVGYGANGAISFVKSDTVILGSIETPTAGTNVTNSLRVTGWTFSNYSISSAVALIDGATAGTVTSFTPRPDVCTAYSNAANCLNSGFLFYLNTTSLSAGEHSLQLKSTAGNGQTRIFPAIKFIKSNSVIKCNLDTPSQNLGAGYGPLPIEGWAVASQGIASIDIMVDNVKLGAAVYGISRPDVCQALGTYPGCPFVGFQYSLSYLGLSNGSHSLRIIAKDSLGSTIGLPATGPITFVVAVRPNTFVAGQLYATDPIIQK